MAQIPLLLWLWRRPAAVALMGPLAWELPCAVGEALKKKKKKKGIVGAPSFAPQASGCRLSGEIEGEEQFAGRGLYLLGLSQVFPSRLGRGSA